MRYRFGGLIFGGTYFRNFTVFLLISKQIFFGPSGLILVEKYGVGPTLDPPLYTTNLPPYCMTKVQLNQSMHTVPVSKSVTAKLNRRELCGFFSMARFFKSTTQKARLNTKAQLAIILKETSRAFCDWLAPWSVPPPDRLVSCFANNSDWMVPESVSVGAGVIVFFCSQI